MTELILMFYSYLFMMNKMNFYLLNNLMFLILFYLLFKFNWLDWSFMILNLSINYYSYGMLLLLILVMSLIFINLKKESKLCFNLNYLLLIYMYMNFLMMNLILYYLMYEINLLLIFYIIIKWGYSKNRFMASYYLMFYTVIFSLPMLFIMFFILKNDFTMNFLLLEMLNLKLSMFMLLYLSMAFLVKIPMYMFHNWLMKAHVEAPFYASMILASIMLKLGSYGLLRLLLIYKYIYLLMNKYILINSLIGMLILSLLCLRQIDMKSLVAMSSVVHMSLMLMGFMTMMKLGMIGGYLMMISHGLSSSGLFYLVNIIYMQTNSRMIFINKGMIIFMPSMSLMWFMLCSSNGGAPVSLNLISEIILLINLINWFKFLFLFLMMYCIFSFMYSIYLFSFIQHGMYYFKFSINNNNMINYLSLLMHWIPLNLLILNLTMII